MSARAFRWEVYRYFPWPSSYKAKIDAAISRIIWEGRR